jgi:hypothetical protein
MYNLLSLETYSVEALKIYLETFTLFSVQWSCIVWAFQLRGILPAMHDCLLLAACHMAGANQRRVLVFTVPLIHVSSSSSAGALTKLRVSLLIFIPGLLDNLGWPGLLLAWFLNKNLSRGDVQPVLSVIYFSTLSFLQFSVLSDFDIAVMLKFADIGTKMSQFCIVSSIIPQKNPFFL